MLDLGLPDMDGTTSAGRIRTWSDVPVVVLSADGTEDRKVDAFGHGADDYMTKPFGMRELNARLQVALRPACRDRRAAAGRRAGRRPLHLDLLRYQATLDGVPST